MNWQLIFRNDYQRLNINQKHPAFKPSPYILIPNIWLPTDKLAVQVVSKKAKPTWKQAGLLKEIQIDVPGQAVAGTHLINLNEKLIIRSNCETRFQFRLDFNKWLENLSISIWKDSEVI